MKLDASISAVVTGGASGLGGAAERGVLGEELEILELAQGREHDQEIGATYRWIKDNRPFL